MPARVVGPPSGTSVRCAPPQGPRGGELPLASGHVGAAVGGGGARVRARFHPFSDALDVHDRDARDVRDISL